MKRRSISNSVWWLIIVVLLAFSYGWIMNIVQIIGMDEFSGFMVVRVIGIFMAPLGGILGYF